ncbi:TetR family transcriptional regulator [Agrobacterium vitis]|uniref:TetR family transcriptional regulator n=2 Tax=Agrobacterium vitis TaxID=373 RepID=A0AAE4WET8_AGRVI|nr:TetR/AcrR family transcriptional regulator [Allorhizobium sp. Av2]MUZ59084.1 TetR family transcriptional regulator [Agrobacterium vitis]MVA68563.1 TetR family transcriptional regulator [Agrobacterium vitis]MVA88549.1 TetR family transcriptional regulator [Agrobacterium vitis]
MVRRRGDLLIMPPVEKTIDARTDKIRLPGRPYSEDLDRAILDAALEALSEVGFEALSISDVSRRAQTTPPAIYRRFATKTKLVLAALEQDLLTIPDTDIDHGGLREDLQWWVRSVFEALSPRRTRILSSLVFQARTDPEPLALLSETIYQFGLRQWSSIIQRATQRGELRQSEIPQLIGKLPGAIAIHFVLLHVNDRDSDVIAELVDTIMLPALLAAAGPVALTSQGSHP